MYLKNLFFFIKSLYSYSLTSIVLIYHPDSSKYITLMDKSKDRMLTANDTPHTTFKIAPGSKQDDIIIQDIGVTNKVMTKGCDNKLRLTTFDNNKFQSLRLKQTSGGNRLFTIKQGEDCLTKMSNEEYFRFETCSNGHKSQVFYIISPTFDLISKSKRNAIIMGTLSEYKQNSQSNNIPKTKNPKNEDDPDLINNNKDESKGKKTKDKHKLNKLLSRENRKDLDKSYKKGKYSTNQMEDMAQEYNLDDIDKMVMAHIDNEIYVHDAKK